MPSDLPASEAPSGGAPRRQRGRAALGVAVLVGVGSVVTLAALLVLAATAASLADGVPAGGAPTVTVTYER
ncbi:hypothetical protein GCM10009609_60800 [Pseudonocardia aurantiaca]|uniref:Uncharacterized protein n=1 Tax=Pseudonocardia aurantiaca TaxID=75290 RepID=A0ABW4FDZ5_9PSEU